MQASEVLSQAKSSEFSTTRGPELWSLVMLDQVDTSWDEGFVLNHFDSMSRYVYVLGA